MISRRIVAGFALAAVMWAALWPLITSAHALASAESTPLCHRAGMQVGVDEPVTHPAGGAPQPGKQHCPLCIMAFLAMGASSVTVVPDRIAPFDLARGLRDVPHRTDRSARLPESRAPPRLVPA